MLAGLVQAPSRLAPTRNPAAARDRASLVLTAMADSGLYRRDTHGQCHGATGTTEPSARTRNRQLCPPITSWTCSMIFVGAVHEDVVVHTSIDLGMQQAAETALITELREQGEEFGVEQGAIVSMRPDGAVQALVGGKDYAESQFNRAVAARRQPGFSLQAFRLSRRRRARPHAGYDPRRSPRAFRQLEPGELHAGLPGPGQPARCAGALAQHGRGAARYGGRCA